MSKELDSDGLMPTYRILCTDFHAPGKECPYGQYCRYIHDARYKGQPYPMKVAKIPDKQYAKVLEKVFEKKVSKKRTKKANRKELEAMVV